jgi:hypothetical protein
VILPRGLILAVVLVLIGLLALIMVGFMFFVRAELSGVQAQRDAQQARLAAESGLEEVITVLRKSPDDPSAWWDVPERFRHALVWAETYTREEDPVRKMGSRREILEATTPAVAWRYSVVAENLDGPVDTIRYGITPEASKLNLNTATDTEIERLLTPLLLDLRIENAPDLVAALLDWRDDDENPRPQGAEDEYYTNLEPGYHAKNGHLDTIEELLLVKGWTAAMLYGEDTNRNGLLDPNEDDRDASFPYYDNGDQVLDRGIAPYVTVWSREPGTSGQQGGPGGGGGTGAGEGGPPASQPGAGTGQTHEGLININTAPLRVLQAIDEMPPAVAEAIVALRRELPAESLADKNWVVTAGAADSATYDQFKDKITTRALQFHVEILGYGDHTKLARRYEWIIEMRGSLAQVLYHRDLTALGFAWPVDDDSFVVTRR